MSALPFVSVVIPTYGRPQFLPETIESVLRQDYAGATEIIVVDDGSPEPVEALVRGRFPQVQFVHKKNEGAASARQLGSELARGPYIAYQDDDDLWEPCKLMQQVGLLEAHPEVDICITDFMKFSAEQEYSHTNFKDHDELWSCPHERLANEPPAFIWEPRAYTPALMMGGPFPPQTTLTRKSFVERIGGWDRRIPGNGQDIEFGIRASWNGRVAFIDRALTRVRRKHGGNISHDVTRTYVNVVRELAKAAEEYPPDLAAFMRRHLGGYYARVGWMLMRDRDFRNAAWHYRRALTYGHRSPRMLLKYAVCEMRGALARA